MPGPDSDRRRHAFGTTIAAAHYDAVRPGYPVEGVTWLLGEPDAPLRVLDLGAGTGKLTRALAGGGHHVIAVDPAGTMLEALRMSIPGAETRVGSAEAIPLSQDAVDAVMIGQAWHWMEPEQAGREIVRVLRPQGRVGLLWNVLDTRSEWVADLSRLTSPGNGHGSMEGTTPDETPEPEVPVFFGSPQRRIIENPHTLSRTDLITLVSTWSWVATHPERERVITEVAALVDRVPNSGRKVTVPQLCYCYRYQLGGLTSGDT